MHLSCTLASKGPALLEDLKPYAAAETTYTLLTTSAEGTPTLSPRTEQTLGDRQSTLVLL